MRRISRYFGSMVPADENSSSYRVDLSSYDTGDFDPGPLVKRLVWYLVSVSFFECRIPWPSSFKSALLSAFGGQVGEGVVIKPGVRIKYPWFLTVGDHCWIGEDAWIDNLCAVTLGDHVTISQGAYLLTGNHDYRSENFDLRIEPISIETGAWVAARALVTPGRTVGENAVLSAGAVLLSDAEASGVYAGNPAIRVRDRL